MIKVSAYRSVPPFARGLVRDLRVRWALEEAGLPYQTRLLDFGEQATPAYRALQPFGQVPAYEEDGLTLFESGAIVLHIAQRSDALMPADANGRARMTTWMFAALNTLEPHISNFIAIDFFHAKEDWAKQRRPALLDMAQTRLNVLSNQLHGRDYLEDRFTAADLMMTTVLRMAERARLTAAQPALEAYRLRCEARPAFQRALARHMADFGEEVRAAS
jgi:glutathione S-transferase